MPRYVVQFTENGEPLIPSEWWATPEFHALRQAHHPDYLKVIVLVNGYRSAYANPDKRLDYKLRIAEVIRDYPRRFGKAFQPSETVMVTDAYNLAQKVFVSGQQDSLWEELLRMEELEQRIDESIGSLNFDGYDKSEEDEEEEPEVLVRGRAKPKAKPKAKKPTAMIQANVLKAQSDSLKSLMESKRQVTDRAEQLRGQLWREIKSRRQARAGNTMTQMTPR